VIDERTISQAVELLRRAAPGATIILFGSYARGSAHQEWATTPGSLLYEAAREGRVFDAVA
jgi:hypothetical protein